MTINDVPITDQFAEAFGMVACRVIVTAASAKWAHIAATEAIGYGTSIIGCDAEAGIERELEPSETPDGRPGVSLLYFSLNLDALAQAVAKRVGQCVLTCATTACFNGLPKVPGQTFRVGGRLRWFGDGYQTSKVLDDRRFWRIPMMDGEFTCEDEFGTTRGIAGGNFLILGETQASALVAAEAAVEAARQVRDMILPFPGGIVRSGSKVGSKYRPLKASTNHAYCPTLRGAINDSALPDSVNAVYEIVIDGLSPEAVIAAMRAGIHAACRPGVIGITAGNYGGKLGPHKIYLHEILGSH
jgi:formylmethanofuran--tetrahydromethanopterin N-formyltransferase